MAFGGILFFNIIFMIVCGVAITGVVSLLVSIVFAMIFIVNKLGGKPTKKRNIVISIVCTIIGVMFMIIPTMLFFIFKPDDVEIQTEQGTFVVAENIVNEFGYSINRDDVDMVKGMLKKWPELINYTFENKTPLGEAIGAESIEVAIYLLEYGVDVNLADNLDFDTSMTLATKNLKFTEREFNYAILNLLMDYDARMNDKISGTTPVQYLILYILEDLSVTKEEMKLLERFVNEGAYLTIEDMSGDDALACFEDEVQNKELTEVQEKEINAMRELLEKYYEQQKAGGDTVNMNELTFNELANILAEFEIADIPQEKIIELETGWEDYPEEVYESLNKMAILLSAAGEGRCDYQTWEWTPTSDKVYSFDMEAFDVGNMYAILFQGIESISKNSMIFTDVVQDDGQGYYDRKVSFRINGQQYEFKAEFGGDWYDAAILDYLNQILAENGSSRQLYFMNDGYQQIIVFYCDAEWAKQFTERTGCVLTNKVN